MKKILVGLLLALTMCFGLCGCGGKTYDEAEKNEKVMAGGYFIVIKEWGNNYTEPLYRLIYAKDTKVIYLYMNSGYGKDITPMYNADGTLQVYTE